MSQINLIMFIITIMNLKTLLDPFLIIKKGILFRNTLSLIKDEKHFQTINQIVENPRSMI